MPFIEHTKNRITNAMTKSFTHLYPNINRNNFSTKKRKKNITNSIIITKLKPYTNIADNFRKLRT